MKKIFITLLAISLLVLTVNGCNRLKKQEAVPPAAPTAPEAPAAPAAPEEPFE